MKTQLLHIGFLWIVLNTISFCQSPAWFEIQPSSDRYKWWRATAVSGDGNTLAAGANYSYVYISKDGGNTWAEKRPAGNNTSTWNTLSINGDGSVILAGDDYNLYVSTDGGISWTSKVANSIISSAISPDGMKMIIGTWQGAYLSTDKGNTWNSTLTHENGMNSVSINYDGSCLLASALNAGGLYLSTNGGASWARILPEIYYWEWRTSITNEGKMLVAPYGGDLLTSDNSGASWTTHNTASGASKLWTSLSVSSAGNKIILSTDARLYYSSDGGDNWIEQNPAGNTDLYWMCTAMSSDGEKIMAGTYGETERGRIWHTVVFSAPTVQSSNISFSDVTSTGMKLGWNNGNGAERIVFAKKGSSGSTTPVDGNIYNASTTFGAGSQISSSGWYCIYKGNGSFASVTGLDENTSYIFQVFEFNGSAGAEKYLKTSSSYNPNSRTTTVLTKPSVQANTLVFTGITSTGMTVSWANGNGAGRVVFAKQGPSGTASPVDNTTYTANSVMRSGSQIGASGWYCVYNGSGNQVTITKMTPNTDYILQVFEYNGGSGKEKYLTSTASDNPMVAGTSETPPDYALAFDGVDDYVDLSTGFNPYNQPYFTMEAWIYPTAFTGDNAILGIGNHAIDTRVLDWRLLGGKVSIGSANGGNWSAVTGSTTLPLNSWTHIAVSCENTAIKIYVNGVLDGSGTMANRANASYVMLGNLMFNNEIKNSFAFQGKIDEVMIWDEIRIEENIQQDMNYGTDGSDLSIRYYYKMSNGSGNTLTDDGPFAKNGTISGATWSVLSATSQASGLIFSSVTPNNLNLAWTSGNGMSRVVFAKEADYGTAFPDDGTTYSAGNGVFGSGSQIGSTGWYCVYDGSGSSVEISGLKGNTAYIFQVMEYTITKKRKSYLTSLGVANPNTTTTAILTPPSTQTSSLTFSSISSSSITIALTKGNGAYRVIFAKKASSGTISPANNITYTANASFGSGTQIGASGWFCIYNGSGSQMAVTGLVPSTDYIFQAFEYNGGSGTELYLDITAADNPKVQATGVKLHRAVKFDGVNDHGLKTLISGLSGSAVTLELWFRPETLNEENFIADLHSKYNSAQDRRIIPMISNTNKVRFWIEPAISGGGGFEYMSDVTVQLGKWYHLAIVLNSTKYSIYIDGITKVNNATLSTAYSLTGYECLALASDYWPNTGAIGSYGNVSIDEVRVWKAARTAEEINDYKDIQIEPQDNLIVYYQMDEGEGNILRDFSGHSNDATLNNGPIWEEGKSFEILAPLSQASLIKFSNVTTNSMSLSWTNGDGVKRVVFAKEGSISAAVPENDTIYTANLNFGDGTQIGSTGWYCVYNGTTNGGSGNGLIVTGLSENTDYYFEVFEYNKGGSIIKYNTYSGPDNPKSRNTFTRMSWSEVRPAGDVALPWATCSMNSDGSKIIAGGRFMKLYRSSNGGANWLETNPGGLLTGYYLFSNISSDGSKVFIPIQSGKTYLSSDGGVTWNWTNPSGGTGEKMWCGSAMSPDGNIIVVADYYGLIYKTTNGGSSWSAIIPFTKKWFAIAMSADGNTIVAAAQYDQQIFITRNGGSNWEEMHPGKTNELTYYTSVAMSQDGTKIITVTQNESDYTGLYISTDKGFSWESPSQLPSGVLNGNFSKVTMSADGSKIVAVQYASSNGRGQVIYSDDFGKNWYHTLPNTNAQNDWSDCAMSYDGKKIIASIKEDGRIWMTDFTVSTPTIQASGLSLTDIYANSLKLKWVNGNGSHRIVFAKQSSYGTVSPVNGSSYSANSIFGLGSQANEPGWYCVYNGDGSSVIIGGLQKNSNYIFKIFEYNGTGKSSDFLDVTGSDNFITGATSSYSPNYSLNFNGSGVSAELPSNLMSPANFTSGLTVEYWFKGTDLQSAVRFQDNSNYIVAGWKSGNNIKFIISNSYGTNGPTICTTFEANDNKWHHIAMTYNKGGDMRTYFDGQLRNIVGTWSYDLPQIISGWLGQYNNSELINGQLDEVRIWNIARTGDQIRADMCKTLSGNETNLVAYYNMNGSLASLLSDITGHGFNARLTGTDNTNQALSQAPLGNEVAVIYGWAPPFEISLSSPIGGTLKAAVSSNSPNLLLIYRVDAINKFTPPEGLENLSADNYYGVFMSGGSNPSYTLTYNYNGHPGISNENSLDLAFRTDRVIGAWSKGNASLNTASKSLTLTGQTGGEYILGSGSGNPLPVELVYFDAKAKKEKVLLKWRTATEVNSFGFEIERAVKQASADQKKDTANKSLSWKEIGFIAGNGNSNSPKDYAFTDIITESASYIYRLKLIDTDGSFSYSDELDIDVKMAPSDYVLFQNYPNPFNPETSIKYGVPVDSRVKMEIFSLSGEKIALIINEDVSAGYYHVILNSSDLNLASGIYLYRLTAEGDGRVFSQSKKLLLIK